MARSAALELDDISTATGGHPLPLAVVRSDGHSGAAKRSWRGWMLFFLGWLFFALGLIGAFLPVLPTTPLMILALWCFSGSSPRFHRWLFNHRLFGPPLQRWQRERVIPLSVKLVASAAMLLSLGHVALNVQPPWYAVGAMAAVMAYGAWFIWRHPSRAA